MTTMNFGTSPALSEISAIGAVGASARYRKWERDQRRDREDRQKKKKTPFQELLDQEVEAVPGQIGSFFEARA
ncbi:MAG: hypothetical protein K6E92_02440 [Lachnospiraceae bacterium]|nr:hypothetical protein [Lachnospiraceae bacterium]